MIQFAKESTIIFGPSNRLRLCKVKWRTNLYLDNLHMITKTKHTRCANVEIFANCILKLKSATINRIKCIHVQVSYMGKSFLKGSSLRVIVIIHVPYICMYIRTVDNYILSYIQNITYIRKCLEVFIAKYTRQKVPTYMESEKY